WAEDGTEESLEGSAELESFPRGQAHAFEAQRPAIAARGLAEAENELAGFVRAGNRVVVAFPHRGEALRTANLLRRVESKILEEGDRLPDEPELYFAVSPARRGFVWRDLGLVLLPDTQVFRKRARTRAAPAGRALQSFADLRTGDFVVHEDHGIGELLALYARRQQAPGVAYELENEWLERLEAEFPYRETEDQRTAIEAVKEDLEAPRPMDRLVCGDVGFGKTEVAVRAAFAVAVNGKQTLMLVPTTVLAQQHWNTFRDRYRDFPVRFEMISRFRSPADVKRVLADYAEGKVDVLIGTHRVLSRDVIPKELGLIVVDEEQRFGVAQKELLRQLRLEVDVLSLTATPIPRTLHMSL